MVNTLCQANSKNQRNSKQNFPWQTYKQISIIFLGRKLADWGTRCDIFPQFWKHVCHPLLGCEAHSLWAASALACFQNWLSGYLPLGFWDGDCSLPQSSFFGLTHHRRWRWTQTTLSFRDFFSFPFLLSFVSDVTQANIQHLIKIIKGDFSYFFHF